jgi:serine O-acetyltransferase
MLKFIEDFKQKARLKQGSTQNLFFVYLKVSLDITIWIVLIYRISNVLNKIKLYPIAKFFWLINRIFFSVDIDPRANLEGGFVLIHGLNIVIGHEVRSSRLLKVYQGVTIGGNIGKRKTIDNIVTGQPVLDNALKNPNKIS